MSLTKFLFFLFLLKRLLEALMLLTSLPAARLMGREGQEGRLGFFPQYYTVLLSSSFFWIKVIVGFKESQTKFFFFLCIIFHISLHYIVRLFF